MLIVGLLLLAGAVIVGIAGVSANTGSEHQLAGGFAIFGYHVHGSAGRLLLAGLLIGAVGMLGFLLATEGVRRNAALRRELFRFRRQARAQERTASATPRRERVLTRTAPKQTVETDGTETGTDTAASDTAADPSAGDSGWRSSVRNWRSPRPTAKSS